MKIITLGLIAVSCLITNAQAEMLSEALRKCSNEDKSLQRLVCYDRVVKDMMQYSGLQQAVGQDTTAIPEPVAIPPASKPLEPSVAPKVPVVATSQQTAEQGVGAELKVDKQLDKLLSEVSAVTKDPRKRQIITLKNGQVWRQVEDRAIKLKVGQNVYIERGMLGAFYMGRTELNKRMKVKRSQ